MSLETWLEEFCPVPAEKMVRKTRLQVVERDLKKWIGLRKTNLRKHGVKKSGRSDISGAGETFSIDGDTCGLCHRYDGNCKPCPISVVRGGLNCDRSHVQDSHSPYSSFTYLDNPEPMIRVLRKAKKMLEEKKR